MHPAGTDDFERRKLSEICAVAARARAVVHLPRLAKGFQPLDHAPQWREADAARDESDVVRILD